MFPNSYFPKSFYSGSYFPPPSVIVKRRPAIGYPGPGAFSLEYAQTKSFEEKKRARRKRKNKRQEEELLLWLLMEEIDE